MTYLSIHRLFFLLDKVCSLTHLVNFFRLSYPSVPKFLLVSFYTYFLYFVGRFLFMDHSPELIKHLDDSYFQLFFKYITHFFFFRIGFWRCTWFLSFGHVCLFLHVLWSFVFLSMHLKNQPHFPKTNEDFYKDWSVILCRLTVYRERLLLVSPARESGDLSNLSCECVFSGFVYLKPKLEGFAGYFYSGTHDLLCTLVYMTLQVLSSRRGSCPMLSGSQWPSGSSCPHP